MKHSTDTNYLELTTTTQLQGLLTQQLLLGTTTPLNAPVTPQLSAARVTARATATTSTQLSVVLKVSTLLVNMLYSYWLCILLITLLQFVDEFPEKHDMLNTINIIRLNMIMRDTGSYLIFHDLLVPHSLLDLTYPL